MSAYDFKDDSLYYNVISLSDLTAEVTNGGSSYTYKTVSIPSEVTYMGRILKIIKVGSSAFRDCGNLVSVTIPEGVMDIGNYAFYGCNNLTSVIIPKGVMSIGNDAFYNCDKLVSVIIPQSVTSIGDWVFGFCGRLTSIVIPEGVTSVGVGAFCECRSLMSVTIPEGVTSIGSRAFDLCSLGSITIPESVTNIGSSTFRDCHYLASITIPENVKELGIGAFKGCNNLASVIIQSKELADLENNQYNPPPFSSCKMSSVQISNSVSKIGNNIFDPGTAKLKEVIIDDCDQPLNLGYTHSQEYNSRYYYGSFSSTSLEKIYFGRNLSYYGGVGGSTYIYTPFATYNSHVKEIYIGDYVSSLNGLSLSDHTELEILTIGKGLSEVPKLSSFSNLTSLTLTSEVPQPASEFTNAQYLNLKVYVPKGSLAAYQSADVWKNFWNLQEVETTGIEHTISKGTTAKELRRYDAAGRKINSLQKGLNIIKMSDGTTKKVIVK